MPWATLIEADGGYLCSEKAVREMQELSGIVRNEILGECEPGINELRGEVLATIAA